MPRATLTHGRNGGRAHAWIAGVPQGFSKQYVFPAGKPLDIEAVDAEALRAGRIELGGRVFEVEAPPARAVVDKAAAGDGAVAAGKPGLPVTGKD